LGCVNAEYCCYQKGAFLKDVVVTTDVAGLMIESACFTFLFEIIREEQKSREIQAISGVVYGATKEL